MKPSIFNISQQALIDNGLDVIDALILSWFSDFTTSGKMKSIKKKDEAYYLLYCQHIFDDLPIINERCYSIQMRVERYIEKGILEKYCDENGETFHYIRLTKIWYDKFLV